MADELVRIGRVGKPHGLDGSFFVERASEDEARFAVGATVTVDGEAATVVGSKRSRGRPVIRLDRDVPRGSELTVPRSELPPPGEGEFYATDLVGLEVEEQGGRVVGKVTSVQPGIANDVLELDSGDLLPLVDACVLQVDLDGRRILIAPGFCS